MQSIEDYLNNLNGISIELVNTISYQKDSITHQLIDKLGSIDAYNEFKNKNANKSINELVLQRQTFKPFVKKNNMVIRKIEPIYHIPDSRIGRAHLFASQKRIGSLLIGTVTFNIAILWIMTTFFCIFLIGIFYRKF